MPFFPPPRISSLFDILWHFTKIACYASKLIRFFSCLYLDGRMSVSKETPTLKLRLNFLMLLYLPCLPYMYNWISSACIITIDFVGGRRKMKKAAAFNRAQVCLPGFGKILSPTASQKPHKRPKTSLEKCLFGMGEKETHFSSFSRLCVGNRVTVVCTHF